MSAAQPLDLAPADVRWPLRPLLDAVGLTRTGLARRLGVAGQTVADAARLGLSDTVADQWAIRLGCHPVDVWGWDWVTAGLSPERGRGFSVLDQLTDRLRDRLGRGDLAPGEPMPTARALAAEWGVSHNTAAKVVQTLRQEGRVVGGGRGRLAYVAARSAHACAACGSSIEPDTEHYPADGNDRRRAVHASCCSCTTGADR